jgi:hypothetical protein
MSESNATQGKRSDSIVKFPLIGASELELGTALGLGHWDFLMWHNQAVSIARFPDDAKLVGVESVLTSQFVEALDFAASRSILDWTQAEPSDSKSGVVTTMVEQQLKSIHRSARVAASVMLHIAIERSIWRHIRFGMVARRDKAVELICERKVSVQELVDKPTSD